MIRCIRLWTGGDQNSHFEEGLLDIEPSHNGDLLTGKIAASTVAFEETHPGGRLDWHTAPVRQLVITLSGTLDFWTRSGAHFLLRPGDILLAEDTAGGGHSWQLMTTSHGGALMSYSPPTLSAVSTKPVTISEG